MKKEKVDQYFMEHFIPYDPVLEWVLFANRRPRLPLIDVARSQGKLLDILSNQIFIK